MAIRSARFVPYRIKNVPWNQNRWAETAEPMGCKCAPKRRLSGEHGITDAQHRRSEGTGASDQVSAPSRMRRPPQPMPVPARPRHFPLAPFPQSAPFIPSLRIFALPNRVHFLTLKCFPQGFAPAPGPSQHPHPHRLGLGNPWPFSERVTSI